MTAADMTFRDILGGLRSDMEKGFARIEGRLDGHESSHREDLRDAIERRVSTEKTLTEYQGKISELEDENQQLRFDSAKLFVDNMEIAKQLAVITTKLDAVDKREDKRAKRGLVGVVTAMGTAIAAAVMHSDKIPRPS